MFSKEICLVQSSNTVFALEDFTLKAERGWGGNDRAGGGLGSDESGLKGMKKDDEAWRKTKLRRQVSGGEGAEGVGK